MGLISPAQVTDGSTAHASDVNNPVNTIANEFNGNIDNANIKSGAAIATAKLASDSGITASMVAPGAITLGYAQSTADFSTSTIADITSLSVTVTIPAGGRKVRITGFAGNASSSSASNGGIMYIVDVTATSQLAVGRGNSDASGDGFTLNPIAVHTPSAGSRTYKLQLGPGSNVTTIHTNGAANNPVFILVEAI